MVQVVSDCDVARFVVDPIGYQCAPDLLENGSGVDPVLCDHCFCRLQSHQEEDQRVHSSVKLDVWVGLLGSQKAYNREDCIVVGLNFELCPVECLACLPDCIGTYFLIEPIATQLIALQD